MSKPWTIRALLTLILLTITQFLFAQAQAQLIAIRAGRLIDGTGAAAIENAVIILNGDKIENIGSVSSTPIPAGARVIDLSQHTVLPGLIEAHAHPYENLNWSVPDTVRMAYIAQGMRIQLRSGVTTYYVAGEIHNMDVVSKQAVEQGTLVGPRIYPAGHWITTTASFGSVLDETYDGPLLIRQKVREMHEQGAHHIKLLLETKPFRNPNNRSYRPGSTNFTKEELDAAIDEAHRLGLKVTAHAYGEGIRIALEAGVDSIQHGEQLDSELISLFRRRNSGFVSTYAIGFGRYFPERWQFAGQANNLKEYLDRWRQVIANARKSDSAKERNVQARLKELKLAKEAGVMVVPGTDNVPGLIPIEMEHLIEAGFTPLEAIAAATGVSAKLLSIDSEVGTLQKGKLADIIAVRGRPDQNLRDLNEIEFIMVGGKDLSAVSFK